MTGPDELAAVTLAMGTDLLPRSISLSNTTSPTSIVFELVGILLTPSTP